MKWFYVIACALGAVMTPNLSSDPLTAIEQVMIQVAFLLTGLYGFKVFSD